MQTERITQPFFYVSFSPWDLHNFHVAFIRHHGFPAGPVLLPDLLGTSAGREQKPRRIQEILDLHPRLRFVLIGDSGIEDLEIYAAVARANPGGILAIYIREVRRDPGDGRVEEVSDTWTEDVPLVLPANTDAYTVTRSRSASSECHPGLGSAERWAVSDDDAATHHLVPGAREVARAW